jgi:hypothetical protein
LRKDAILTALDTVNEKDLNHFNVHCPRCRKANRVAKQRLLRAAPDWVPLSEREDNKTEDED